jgi:hypothetical protein
VGLTVEEGDNRVSVRMDFSPKNVDLEVRVPRRLSSQQGDVFTDFDVTIEQDPNRVERSGDAGGRYVVRMQRSMRYAIGGGGPDIQLRTFDGDIMIRKR